MVTLWDWCLVVNEMSWWMSQVTVSFILVFKFNFKWNVLLFELNSFKLYFDCLFWKPIKRTWCEEQERFADVWRDKGDNLLLFIFFINCICLCVQKLEACAVNYFNKLCKLSLCSHFKNLLNFISYSTTLINSLITGRRDQWHCPVYYWNIIGNYQIRNTHQPSTYNEFLNNVLHLFIFAAIDKQVLQLTINLSCWHWC